MDLLCQDIIIGAIRKKDKNASIYSEELDSLNRLKTDRKSLKYIIDPIDGTHNFCFGIPFWGISVAVVDELNRPQAGIINIPEFGILLKKEKRNTHTMIFSKERWRPLSTSKRGIKQGLLCYDNQFYKLDKNAFRIYKMLMRHFFTTRITGSASADIALIATGKINARVWNSTNPYDIAAGIPIIEGAGGIMSDFTGKRADVFSSKVIAASSRSINRKIVDIIRSI
jgi:myo-inositol-1(or 4)-monophosphatase